MSATTDPRTSETTGGVDLSDPDLYAHGIPHDVFAELRERGPVLWNAMPDEPGFWAVLRHRDVAVVSRDTTTFSSWEGGTMIRDESVVPLDIWRQTMLNMDPPEHTRYRALVNTAFTARRVADLEPQIRARTAELLEAGLARDDFDLVRDVAKPLPLEVICLLLGVPEPDYEQIADWTAAAAGFDDDAMRGDKDGLQVFYEGMGFFHALGEERKREPRKDLITALNEAEVEGRRLTEIELTAFLGLLAVGGTDTTRNSYAGGMLAFLEHPEQWDRLQADPSLVATAVEEMIRWVTPFTHFRRTAVQDTEVAGVPVRKGEKVVLWYASTNRDEDAFDAPERFDVGRDPNHHQGFGGGGKHFCIGAGLARLELRILLEESLRLLPRLELAGPVERVRSNWLTSLHRLPVRPAG